MSILSMVFGKPKPAQRSASSSGYRRLAVPPEISEELTELEEQILVSELPEEQAPHFNRAGDLCAQCEQIELALGYYDRAIDGYLRAGRYELARAVCRKLLRLWPSVVRARSTLAWLAIRGEGRAEAERGIQQYVDASLSAFVDDLAAKHLIAMEKSTDDGDLREAIALHLLSLGAAKAADTLLHSLYAERNGRRPPRDGTDARRSWQRALDHAVLAKPEPWREALNEATKAAG